MTYDPEKPRFQLTLAVLYILNGANPMAIKHSSKTKLLKAGKVVGEYPSPEAALSAATDMGPGEYTMQPGAVALGITRGATAPAPAPTPAPSPTPAPAPTGITVLPAVIADVTLEGEQALAYELSFLGDKLPETAYVRAHLVDADDSKVFLNEDFAVKGAEVVVADGKTTFKRRSPNGGKIGLGKWKVGTGLFEIKDGTYPDVAGQKLAEGVTKDADGRAIVGEFSVLSAAPAPAPAPAPTPSPGGYGTPERPFRKESLWNTPIALNAVHYSDDGMGKLRAGGEILVNAESWTIPIYYAKSSDPWEEITVKDPKTGGQYGKPRIQIPAGAAADKQNDAHMVIISADRRWAHELWYVRGVTGSRTASAYAKSDIVNGDGIFYTGEGALAKHGQYYATKVTEQYGWGATRAYGGSSFAGILRPGDLTSDVEPYSALMMSIYQDILAYPGQKGLKLPVPPASKDDGPSHGYTGGAAGIVMGSRLAIPPGVDISRLSITGQRIARRLIKFGAYVVDQSGGTRFNSELNAARAEGRAFNAMPAAERNFIRDNLRLVLPRLTY